MSLLRATDGGKKSGSVDSASRLDSVYQPAHRDIVSTGTGVPEDPFAERVVLKSNGLVEQKVKAGESTVNGSGISSDVQSPATRRRDGEALTA